MSVKIAFVLILLASLPLACHGGVFGFLTGLVACETGCAAGYAACLAAGCGAASKFPHVRRAKGSCTPFLCLSFCSGIDSRHRFRSLYRSLHCC